MIPPVLTVVDADGSFRAMQEIRLMFDGDDEVICYTSPRSQVGDRIYRDEELVCVVHADDLA